MTTEAPKEVTPSATREDIAAWHEAGHAVAAILLNHKLKYVTIAPGKIADGRTKCVTPRSIVHAWKIGDRDSPRVAHWFERELIMILAGGITQKLAFPWSDWRQGMGENKDESIVSGSDLKCVLHLVDEIHGWATPVAEAYLKYVYARADALVEAHWQEIRLVAEALLKDKTLSADAVRAVMFPEFAIDKQPAVDAATTESDDNGLAN